MTSPSAGSPKTFSTSPENTQSCPCKMRARGLTTRPAIREDSVMLTLRNIDLPGFTKLRSGKVREVFDLGDTLLFVATDRLSAFDVVFDDPIPGKGAVLNQISAFWFQRLRFVAHHFITAAAGELPDSL